jgi:hypothetical protein
VAKTAAAAAAAAVPEAPPEVEVGGGAPESAGERDYPAGAGGTIVVDGGTPVGGPPRGENTI